MTRHLRMSNSEFKLSLTYLRSLSSIVNRVSCLTLALNLTILSTRTYLLTISFSSILLKLKRLWIMLKWTRLRVERAIAIRILKSLSMLFAKSTTISIDSRMMIATTIATTTTIAISIRFMNIVRILTSTTIAM